MMPKSLTLPQLDVQKNYLDDIECKEWLEEVGLGQYEETFAVNFTRNGGSVLLRKRLAQVRLQDFPKMGIYNFVHAKMLLAHIRFTLQYQFHSPMRRKQTQEMTESMNRPRNNSVDSDTLSSDDIGAFSPTILTTLAELPLTDESNHNKKPPPPQLSPLHSAVNPLEVPGKRRRSFDKHAWQSISLLRTASGRGAEAAEQLRHDTNSPSTSPSHKNTTSHVHLRRRSQTFHRDGGYLELSSVEKGLKYGNMVQVYDLIQKDMGALRLDLLRRLRHDLHVERVDFLLYSKPAQELFFCTRGHWYRTPLSGTPGSCIETAETISVSDPASDARYNPNVDAFFRQTARNILCCPVHGRRGGGDMIAVVQCCNKEGGRDFSLDDEDRLSDYCQRIADELAERLAVVLVAPSAFAGSAIFIDTTAAPQLGRHHFGASTAASRMHQETSAQMQHDELLVEHTQGLRLQGPDSTEVDEERVRLSRRQHYAK